MVVGFDFREFPPWTSCQGKRSERNTVAQEGFCGNDEGRKELETEVTTSTTQGLEDQQDNNYTVQIVGLVMVRSTLSALLSKRPVVQAPR